MTTLSFDHQLNNEIIFNHKKRVRKLNKQVKELKHSITFFSINKFDDVPETYVVNLQDELSKVLEEINYYNDIINMYKQ